MMTVMPRPKPQVPGLTNQAPPPTDPPAPFIWGAGGEAMSPEEVARQRQIAEQLSQEGMSYAPVQSWTQGAARVADALVGGLQESRAARSETEGKKSAQDALAAYQAEESSPNADPKAHIAHAMMLADNPWLGQGARAVLLESLKQKDGPFPGTGYESASANILVRGQKDSNLRATPEYAMAWAQQTQPKVVQDAQGRSVLYTPPPPQGILPPISGQSPQIPPASPAAPTAPQSQPSAAPALQAPTVPPGPETFTPTSDPTAPPPSSPVVNPTPVGSATVIPGLDAARNDTWDAPVQVEIKNPDTAKGGTVQMLAQQNKRTGQWATADEKRTPLDATGLTIVNTGAGAGGREGIMLQRILNNAREATSEIGNIVELPVTSDTGFLGTRKQGGNLMTATLDTLVNTVNPQEVQDMNVSTVGLGRALAGLETSGMQVNGALMASFENLQLRAGDTQLTKMRKLATMRQQADNALETLLTNPRLGKDQREFATSLRSQLATSIPFTVHDVTQLERSGNPQASLGDFAKGKNLGVTPPQAAIEMLKANPGTRAHFDETFGPGASDKVLGPVAPQGGKGGPELQGPPTGEGGVQSPSQGPVIGPVRARPASADIWDNPARPRGIGPDSSLPIPDPQAAVGNSLRRSLTSARTANVGNVGDLLNQPLTVGGANIPTLDEIKRMQAGVTAKVNALRGDTSFGSDQKLAAIKNQNMNAIEGAASGNFSLAHVYQRLQELDAMLNSLMHSSDELTRHDRPARPSAAVGPRNV